MASNLNDKGTGFIRQFIGLITSIGLFWFLSRSQFNLKHIGAAVLSIGLGLLVQMIGALPFKSLGRRPQNEQASEEAKSNTSFSYAAVKVQQDLTGTRTLNDYLKILKSYIKSGNTAGFCVIAVVDVDFLENINQKYSRAVGDEVLSHVASLIKKTVRLYHKPGFNRMLDFACRFEDDSFLIVFNEVKDGYFHTGALRLLNSIKDAKLRISSSLTDGKSIAALSLSASIGISVWNPSKFSDLEHVIETAKKSSEEAKDRGRGCIVSLNPKQVWA